MRLYIIYTFANKIKKQEISKTNSIIEQYNSIDYLLKICSELLDIEINIPAKLQLMVNFLSITHKKDSTNLHERYYIELFNNALKIDIDYLSMSFIQFENIFSNFSSLMENIAVNDIFRNTSCYNCEDLYYSNLILIIMMSLIKFTIFLEWLDSEKKDIYKLDYNVIVYYSRKFEHISFVHLKNQLLECEKEGWLSPGNIFTLLK